MESSGNVLTRPGVFFVLLANEVPSFPSPGVDVPSHDLAVGD